MRRKPKSNDSEVVKDGDRVRVPLMLRDGEPARLSDAQLDALPGWQRDAILAHRARVAVDASARAARAFSDEIATDTPATVVDAFGGDGLALRRPGARYLHAGLKSTDHALHAVRAMQRQEAYLQAKQDLQDAWRHPARDAERDGPITGYGSHGFSGGRLGDPCTCRGPEYPLDFGSPGRLEERNGELICVPDRKREGGLDARAAAYQDSVRELMAAWKKGPAR
jgi:hypothetical protein